MSVKRRAKESECDERGPVRAREGAKAITKREDLGTSTLSERTNAAEEAVGTSPQGLYTVPPPPAEVRAHQVRSITRNVVRELAFGGE